MFKTARVKLTLWYLLIIMLVSSAFSVVVYTILSHEFERFARAQEFRFENEFNHLPDDRPFSMQMPLPHPELVTEVTSRLALTLVVINIVILVIAGLLGYFLAGKTLNPIKNMVDQQNRFITDASHEFRTPLTSLKSSMEVFLRGSAQTLAEAQTLIKDSVGDVDRLTYLSNSLLQLSQYDKPKATMATGALALLALDEVLNEAVTAVGALANPKEISITKNDTDLTVTGNKYSLEELFTIILDNAIKYSSPKSNIGITTSRNAGLAEIAIKDSGIGIDPKDLPHIFDRFYRADSARSKISKTGYGLGLSIAESIVKSYKGTIKVSSELNVGTTVIISLPITFS